MLAYIAEAHAIDEWPVPSSRYQPEGLAGMFVDDTAVGVTSLMHHALFSSDRQTNADDPTTNHTS